MDTQKIYLSEDKGSMDALLASALSNKGLDASSVAAMLNNRGGLGGNLSDIIALVVIASIFGWNNGRGGFGGSSCGCAEREMIMSAIQRNGTDIASIASAINCSSSQVNNAISALATQISNFAGQSGLSSQQIINSVQLGNSTLASQIASCCCDVRNAITTQGYENRLANQEQTTALLGRIDTLANGIQTGFASTAYETASQTCALKQSIADGVNEIIKGQNAAEMRELNAKIDHLREENSAYKSSAMTSQIVGGAIAPINAALAALQSDVNAIKCAQPSTATVPYYPFTPVPNCIAASLGIGQFAGLANYAVNPNNTPYWG